VLRRGSVVSMDRVKTSLDLINEFEKTFEVEKWTVNGLHIWPSLRIPLVSAWEKVLYYKNEEFVKSKLTLVQKIKKEIYWFKLALRAKKLKNIYSRHNADIGIWSADIYRVYDGKHNYSRFSDAFYDLESGSGLNVLSVNITMKMVSEGYYPGVDITFEYLLARYYALVKSLFSFWWNVDVDLSGPLKWCSSYGLPSVGLYKRNIYYHFCLLTALKKQSLKIINKYQLKACLKVCWYSPEGMALAWAAKEAKIPCYDLQHGIAGASNHMAYCGWECLPKGGYEIIPENFWCWTNEDARVINAWGKLQNPIVNTYVGGNIWQRLWYEDKLPKNFFMSTIKNSEFLRDHRIKILFTMQTGNVPSILFELIEKSPVSWNWWIRCHPNQLENMLSITESLKQFNNVDISNSSIAPLPLLLKHADVHITGWSAVVYDARDFGLLNIVYHPSAHRYFKKDIKMGDLIYSDDVCEIINIINNCKLNTTLHVNRRSYPSFKYELHQRKILGYKDADLK
jgi:hypothetical protein